MKTHVINIYSIQTPLEDIVCGVIKDNVVFSQFHDSGVLTDLKKKLEDDYKYKIIEEETDLHKKISKQINKYFSGELKRFDLPIFLVGSEFQKKVWKMIREIPYGKQQSYLEFARNYGDAKAIRAVAHANGTNPLNVIIPCHRIIGSDGDLTGYAGKTWRKKKLLELEQGILQTTLF